LYEQTARWIRRFIDSTVGPPVAALTVRVDNLETDVGTLQTEMAASETRLDAVEATLARVQSYPVGASPVAMYPNQTKRQLWFVPPAADAPFEWRLSNVRIEMATPITSANPVTAGVYDDTGVLSDLVDIATGATAFNLTALARDCDGLVYVEIASDDALATGGAGMVVVGLLTLYQAP